MRMARRPHPPLLQRPAAAGGHITAAQPFPRRPAEPPTCGSESGCIKTRGPCPVTPASTTAPLPPNNPKHRKLAGNTHESPIRQLMLPSETEKRWDIVQGKRRRGFSRHPDNWKLTGRLDRAPLAFFPKLEDPRILQREHPTTLAHSPHGHRRQNGCKSFCKLHKPTHITPRGK